MTNNAPDRPEPPATAAPSPPAERPDEPGRGAFPIVGVGASAGGLEAFTALLKALPLDTGMGFVLVQHLDPQHESVLTQLLARATSLPVQEVTNNLRVEPNRVYVIPPNANLSIAQGVLRLQPREGMRTPHRSIDSFFESLAQDRREQAIGVILSGTATDGTLGMEAIKAEGGITFAQDDSARYDSMPRSAAAAGCVDFVLSPEDMATELARIAKHPYVAGQGRDADSPEDDRAAATTHEDDETPLPPGGRGSRARARVSEARAEARAARAKSGEDGYRKILLLLRDHSGVDFSLYKSTTIQRRVTRRMVLNRHHAPGDYAAFLKGNAKELDALYADVLISVTSFFRNPEAFDVLKSKVIPRLLQGRSDEPFRVWVLGCSTGQEAYSIAMAFAESAEKALGTRRLQVFATDLNEALLDKARHGLYARSLVGDVSPERLRRFFVEEEGGYRVSKLLREMVVFARQNLISDPPFSRMDLISCRNLLIYLEPGLQQKALPTFHYALKPEGFLFLGASESIGGFTELFEPVDRKHRIYSRKAAPTPAFHPPARKDRGEPRSSGRRKGSPLSTQRGEALEGLPAESSAQREADRVTVNQFAPPGVLVNDELQILQFRGQTSAYLTPPAGRASFDVLKMAREGLMLPLRAALSKAKKDNKPARRENVKVGPGGAVRQVNVEIIPLRNLRERSFLILFEDAGKAARAITRAPSREPSGGAEKTPRRTGKQEESRRISELETDLAGTRDYLQSMQEQHEAANEELQSANEEVQSANEELQSLNEELETSKEELESANEELTTVNEEMANRNAELNRLNSDLVNLQTSTGLAIVLLGRDLTIRRFSAQAEKQLGLLTADVGKPFGNVRHDLVFAEGDETGDPRDLESFIAEVVTSVHEGERKVRDREGRWYSLRVRPYLTLDNKVDGAVLVLVDIDAAKRGEQAIAAARDYAEAIVQSTRDPLLILDADLRVSTANEAFYRKFKVSGAQSQGRSIYDLGNGQWDIPRLRELLQDILPRNSFFNDFEITHDFETIGRRTMLLNARTLREVGEGRPTRILLGIEDVTERQRADALTASLAAIVNSSEDAIIGKDLTGVINSWNKGAERLFGYTAQEAIGRPITMLIPPQRLAEEQEILTRIRRGEWIAPFETVRVRKDRSRLDVSLTISPIKDAAGRVIGASKIARDITDRRMAEKALREAGERFRFMAESMPGKIFTAGPGGEVDYFNPRWTEFTGLTLEQIRDWGWTQVIHPDDAAESMRVWRHSIDTGEPFRFDHRFRAADGTYRWHQSQAVALKDVDGKVLMWVAANADVHEVKEADRRKEEFLAVLAHELRGPLAPLSNMLEIMTRAQSRDDVAQEALGTMQRQLGQMTRLIDDLLDAGRMSRNKLDLRLGTVELASVVRHTVEACRATIDAARHELTVTLPPQPVYLHADPTRLMQVLGNLLNNACKFTEPGGHISLTAEREGADVVVSVKDDGMGIPPDMLRGIFDMFMQVDRSLERARGGLGIGLTLARQLVEMHGGSVKAYSEGLGRGSEMVVRLPVSIETPEPAPPGPGVSEPAPTLARRILVVDDNRDAAISLTMLLQMAGHETRTAHDGVEALDAAAAFRPDIVLLDIGLPKLNGYEVARKIRGEPWGKDIALIALSGWGQDEDRRKSREAGFDGHLIKPVDYATLKKLLAESK